MSLSIDERLFAGLLVLGTIWIRNSSVASSSTRWDDSLFFRISWIALCVPTQISMRRAEQELELVDHQHVGRIGDDDLEAGRRPAPRARSCSGTSGRPGSSGTARGRSRSSRGRRTRCPRRSARRCAWNSSERTSPARRRLRRRSGTLSLAPPCALCRLRTSIWP